MPSEAAHLAIAERNRVVLDYLLERIENCAEWVTTVAFYRALHLVEAVFYHDGHEHGRNHETRERMLKTNNRYKHIYQHYRPLWAASVVARYLEDADNSAPFSSFSEYLKPDDVKRIIIDHRLRQIENSVAKLLASSP
jgi:hypothetical protein